MKLKNKKTGEIVSLQGELLYDDKVRLLNYYGSLAEFNEEWEDMPEEPKGIQGVHYVNHFDATKMDGVLVDFETKEEAEKAVEKLKAWKRLKDKGFRFTGLKKIYQGRSDNPIGYTESPTYISFNKATEDFVSPTGDWVKENWDDLQLIFGGEE